MKWTEIEEAINRQTVLKIAQANRMEKQAKTMKKSAEVDKALQAVSQKQRELANIQRGSLKPRKPIKPI